VEIRVRLGFTWSALVTVDGGYVGREVGRPFARALYAVRTTAHDMDMTA
jgi:hypothetical protein